MSDSECVSSTCGDFYMKKNEMKCSMMCRATAGCKVDTLQTFCCIELLILNTELLIVNTEQMWIILWITKGNSKL